MPCSVPCPFACCSFIAIYAAALAAAARSLFEYISEIQLTLRAKLVKHNQKQEHLPCCAQRQRCPRWRLGAVPGAAEEPVEDQGVLSLSSDRCTNTSPFQVLPALYWTFITSRCNFTKHLHAIKPYYMCEALRKLTVPPQGCIFC